MYLPIHGGEPQRRRLPVTRPRRGGAGGRAGRAGSMVRAHAHAQACTGLHRAQRRRVGAVATAPTCRCRRRWRLRRGAAASTLTRCLHGCKPQGAALTPQYTGTAAQGTHAWARPRKRARARARREHEHCCWWRCAAAVWQSPRPRKPDTPALTLDWTGLDWDMVQHMARHALGVDGPGWTSPPSGSSPGRCPGADVATASAAQRSTAAPAEIVARAVRGALSVSTAPVQIRTQ